ncbi:MAG: PAS domain-containing sensor histidine kinase, partial [Geopsychrobacter sp.]|nr:PAS domain-containing sensor histidine kinase [Geopsychrobacter sp.]
MGIQNDIQREKIPLELQIKELTHSLEQLEASRNQYAFLYDFAPVGYFTFDFEGRILALNPAGERLLG